MFERRGGGSPDLLQLIEVTHAFVLPPRQPHTRSNTADRNRADLPDRIVTASLLHGEAGSRPLPVMPGRVRGGCHGEPTHSTGSPARAERTPSPAR